MSRTMLAVFAFFAVGAIGLAGDEKVGALWKWEYRIASKDELAELGNRNVAAGLNKLGEEGWELVAVESGAAAVPVQFYLKRLKDLPLAQREAATRRVAAAEAEVELWRERAAYSERMVKKGFLAENQARADLAQLRHAEVLLSSARRELEALTPPKPAPEKVPQPEKRP